MISDMTPHSQHGGKQAMRKFFMKHIEPRSGNTHEDTIEAEDFHEAYSVAWDRCAKNSWRLTRLHEVTAVKPTSYEPRMPLCTDYAVTKHLTPAGVEYRDQNGVVIAVLSRSSAGLWEVNPVADRREVNPVYICETGYFTSAKAADAYAWVINLERMHA